MSCRRCRKCPSSSKPGSSRHNCRRIIRCFLRRRPSMFDHPVHPEIAEWFVTFGVAEVPYSVCSIDLTNEPPKHWFYQRNKLRPESLKLDLCIPSNGNWCVDL